MRDVTPVTDGPTVESRAVFCLSKIRNNKKRTENGINCELHFIQLRSGTIICENVVRKVNSQNLKKVQLQNTFYKQVFRNDNLHKKKGFMSDDLPDLKQKIICDNNLKNVV